MTDASKPWDAAQVRTWLERRHAAAKLDQAAADRRGYDARDDYDKAAAEAWVCDALRRDDCIDDPAALAARLKQLIARDEYPATGLNDDDRFDRHVRTYLRRLARMTKANEGFANTFRHQ
jgi:hypothetical protein